MGATPNGISAVSLVFAVAGCIAFISTSRGWLAYPWIGWVLGACCVQLRLICNLLDGMVAIEGGKRTATGGVWNEVPDRFADSLFLIGAGIGCGMPWAGMAVAWAAVMTAYVRSLGAELTGKQDFCGPFAKPHRMAVLTVAALLTSLTDYFPFLHWLMPYTLCVLAVGTFLTVLRRLHRLANRLKNPAP